MKTILMVDDIYPDPRILQHLEGIAKVVTPKPRADSIVTDKSRLRQISKPTTIEEVARLNLIARLRTANDHAWTNGCGLAAIQIGIPLRFAWFRWGEEEFTLLNPVITAWKGKEKAVEEGCLSIPRSHVRVKRFYKIKFYTGGWDYSGPAETARGFKAHIIQHEIDHMNGILNIDKMVK